MCDLTARPCSASSTVTIFPQPIFHEGVLLCAVRWVWSSSCSMTFSTDAWTIALNSSCRLYILILGAAGMLLKALMFGYRECVLGLAHFLRCPMGYDHVLTGFYLRFIFDYAVFRNPNAEQPRAQGA